jgi:hypothetical protein
MARPIRNIFLVYMPPGNLEAMKHYQDTIRQRVSLDRVSRFVSRQEVGQLQHLFGGRPMAIWGSRDSSANRSRFEKMRPGDDLLIVEGSTIRFIGKIALKTTNPALSRELWKSMSRGSSSWDLIYFVANPIEIKVPFRQFCKLFGYRLNWQLRGLTTLKKEKLASFYERYDDLYSILLKLQSGEEIVAKEDSSIIEEPPPLLEVEVEDIDEVLADPGVSEHVKMQWKLAKLGLKAGEKIWVPNGDQSKLRKEYNFTEFESEFSAGIDLPKSYFENIDVVWKEQFRISAAFEIENSTAIYSGLLRFADLKVVAPNTIYPMFIVAPAERRNRARTQLQRPVFGQLDLQDKVRFLPYEAIDEIDKFFASTTSGLSVDVVVAKSESLAA